MTERTIFSSAYDTTQCNKSGKIRVLIVDDSHFIQDRLEEIISEDPELEVVGRACNGIEAVDAAQRLVPDVITMDVEMPLMDGVTAVREIMRRSPTSILMFSVLTTAGAKASMDALDAGAIDFLPKNLEEIDANRSIAKRIIQRRIKTIGKASGGQRLSAKSPSSKACILRNGNVPGLRRSDFNLMVIAASTGGPVVIQNLLSQLKSDFPWPVLIIQHMPEKFTASFAERLDQLSGLTVSEAAHGQLLMPGRAFLVPGGCQLELPGDYQKQGIIVRKSRAGEYYKPCADITLRSISDHFKGSVLALVLTGMGNDGKVGSWFLKKHKARIWAQDEESCAVYGMPKAVTEAGLVDAVYSPEQMIEFLTAVR